MLGEFLDDYITRRMVFKPQTRINLQACKARLVEYIGKDRPVKDINPGDSDAWLLWLREH